MFDSHALGPNRSCWRISGVIVKIGTQGGNQVCLDPGWDVTHPISMPVMKYSIFDLVYEYATMA